MFLAMISEGYMDLKSRTQTQWYSPGVMVCTYPPSICSEPAILRPMLGTAMFPRSAARMSRESASWEDPDVRTSSMGSLDTAARSMPFLRVPTSSRMRSASSASLVQYSMTFSLFSFHSESMRLGSTSILPSPRSCMETAFRVSCLGRISLLAAHHASHMSLPFTLQNLSLKTLGWPPSLPQGRASFILLALALSEIFRMS